MNKRFLSLMLLGLTALALVACSDGGDDEETAPAPTASQPVPTATAPGRANAHHRVDTGAHSDQQCVG